MRLLLFILGVLVAIVCIEKPAAADRQWCAYYDGCGGGSHQLRVFNISTMLGDR
jgi:hypothetical protein